MLLIFDKFSSKFTKIFYLFFEKQYKYDEFGGSIQ